jgi:predicted nucleic acid-binding protein
MPRSFLDSGVLIDAARAARGHRNFLALSYFDDPSRTYLTSPLIRLETVPKAAYNRQTLELQFYQDFFADSRIEWCRDWQVMATLAEEQAVRYGLSAMDALHLAAAYLLGADEFVTTEKPQKPIHRSPLVRVIYLYS